MKRQQSDPLVSRPLLDPRGRRIGRVEAAFADYLLVRTRGLLPIDLYVPRPEVREEAGQLRTDFDARDAQRRWHRPLKRAPHD